MEASTPGSDARALNGLDPDQLRAEIEAARLQLYFQPIVSLRDRSATMLEALPRWPHPARGILAPSDFIALAEANGLLELLERWAIDAAFHQLSQWTGGVAGQLTISLNLSEEHLYEADLATAVRDAAGKRGVEANRLGFEISETPLIEAGGRSLEKLRALADLGVSLTIDDYHGAVATDLLRQLPTNALKISRRIVAGIPDDPRSVEAAAAAVAVGEELDVAVIASGVEGPGQLASLRDLGCSYAQGFLLSLPMPADVLEERMVRR